MVKPPKEESRQVEYGAMALSILECYIGGETELTLKDISEKTGLYKSRIFRICGTLVARDIPSAEVKWCRKLAVWPPRI